jgi:hypothetical protein
MGQIAFRAVAIAGSLPFAVTRMQHVTSGNLMLKKEQNWHYDISLRPVGK